MNIFILVYEDKHTEDIIKLFKDKDAAIWKGREMLLEYIEGHELEEESKLTENREFRDNEEAWIWLGELGDDDPVAHVEVKTLELGSESDEIIR